MPDKNKNNNIFGMERGFFGRDIKEETGLNNLYSEGDKETDVLNNTETEQHNGQRNYTANEEDQRVTGSGIEAAVGTDYTWNKDSQEKARSQYEIDLETKKQELQANAQTIANNAVNYQAASDMQKYQANQNAEKVGWTGGYILDQKRQMEYLNQSIASQMYGAIQLQKHGYDSALAAARYSYDLNQKEYALQYYKEAQTLALEEAQRTGTYFSAEAKDMMSQRSVAKEIISELEGKSDDELTEEERQEKERAEKIVKTINDWFRTNNISESGVETLALWQAEQANEIAWQSEIWNEYNAALEAAKADVNNSTTFLAYNNDGKIDYIAGEGGVGSEVRSTDLSTLTADGLASYILKGLDGTELGNSVAITKRTEQIQAYINYLYEKARTDATTVNKNNGAETTTFNEEKYKSAKEKIDQMVSDINDKLWKTDTGNINITSIKTSEDNPNIGGGENPQTYHDGKWFNDQETYTLQDLMDNYNNAKSTNFTFNVRLEDMRSDFGVHASIDSWQDDDMDINVYSDGTRKKNYDVDIDWSAGQSRKRNGPGDWSIDEYTDVGKTLNNKYPDTKDGTIVVYKGKIYISRKMGDHICWGLVKSDNLGGKRLYDDIIGNYTYGTTPERWS